jgi:hypothetical protein
MGTTSMRNIITTALFGLMFCIALTAVFLGFIGYYSRVEFSVEFQKSREESANRKVD